MLYMLKSFLSTLLSFTVNLVEHYQCLFSYFLTLFSQIGCAGMNQTITCYVMSAFRKEFVLLQYFCAVFVDSSLVMNVADLNLKEYGAENCDERRRFIALPEQPIIIF